MSTPNPVPPTSTSTLATLEARVKLLESKAGGWLKNNWSHFVTWLGLVYVIFRH